MWEQILYFKEELHFESVSSSRKQEVPKVIPLLKKWWRYIEMFPFILRMEVYSAWDVKIYLINVVGKWLNRHVSNFNSEYMENILIWKMLF